MSNSRDLILLVEDEEVLGEGLIYNFEAEGFTTEWHRNGTSAMHYIEENHGNISLIVLDLMLPEIDGFEILRRTRALAERVPILVLSARTMESDKVRAFETGADDYVTKPFSLSELILRLRGLMRRSSWYWNHRATDERVPFGNARFSSARLSLEKSNGEIVRLSPIEAVLVQTFLDFENKILSRSDLLEKAWNQEKTIQTRTVDVFLSKLRKIIEVDSAKPEFLISVRGIGYAYITDAALRAELLLK